VTYATMGAVQPTTPMFPYSGGAWLAPCLAAIDLDPIIERGVWMDPSHLPVPQQSALLKTGMPEWQDQMIQEANPSTGQMFIPTTTVGSNTKRGGVPHDEDDQDGDCPRPPPMHAPTPSAEGNRERRPRLAAVRQPCGLDLGYSLADRAYIFLRGDSSARRSSIGSISPDFSVDGELFGAAMIKLLREWFVKR
jgi:hypothetical protein